MGLSLPDNNISVEHGALQDRCYGSNLKFSDKQSVQNAIKIIDSHNIDYALFMMLQYNLVQYS